MANEWCRDFVVVEWRWWMNGVFFYSTASSFRWWMNGVEMRSWLLDDRSSTVLWIVHVLGVHGQNFQGVSWRNIIHFLGEGQIFSAFRGAISRHHGRINLEISCAFLGHWQGQYQASTNTLLVAGGHPMTNDRYYTLIQPDTIVEKRWSNLCCDDSLYESLF